MKGFTILVRGRVTIRINPHMKSAIRNYPQGNDPSETVSVHNFGSTAE